MQTKTTAVIGNKVYVDILLLGIVKQNESNSLYPLHRFCFYREKSDIPLVHVTSSAQSAVDQQT